MTAVFCILGFLWFIEGSLEPNFFVNLLAASYFVFNLPTEELWPWYFLAPDWFKVSVF